MHNNTPKSWSLIPRGDGNKYSVDNNQDIPPIPALFYDDFSDATDLNSLLTTNGGEWGSYEDIDPGQLEVELYPEPSYDQCIMLQYVNSDDENLLRTPQLLITEGYFQVTEFHSIDYDAGPTKDYRWHDPVTGIDLYLSIGNDSNNPGVVQPINRISFHVQGSSFVPGGSQGDPNTYFSVPFAWDNTKEYKITLQIKLNTQGNSDGELRLWVDEVLLHEELNLKISADTVSDYTLKSFDIGMSSTNYGQPFDSITKRYITNVGVYNGRPF